MRFAVFTENNSPFGTYFINKLAIDRQSDLVAVVLRAEDIKYSYYIGDSEQVDNADLATRLGVTVFRPTATSDPEFLEQLNLLNLDYFIVANYQLKLEIEVLGIPSHHAINFHPAPLPRYAGLAPFHWMGKNHETRAGVSATLLADQLDAGDIVAQHLFSLKGTESEQEIREVTFSASWRLFDLILPTLNENRLASYPQDLKLRTYFERPDYGKS